MDSLKTEFLKDVNSCHGILHQVCRIYTRGEDGKEDLFQEILYQLWKSYPTFQGKSKFSTWLYRVALNTAITSYKKFEKRNQYELHVEDFPDRKEEGNEEEEKINNMYGAIYNLGKVDKALILLFLEDKKYEEIAEILGMTTSNVGVRLLRARKKLETMINENAQDN